MNNKMIYRVKSHVDINYGLHRYDFDDEYRYYELIEYSSREYLMTVDCLCGLEEKHGYKPFKKGKRLFSKI